MEYTQEVEIALPRDEVIRLFDDPANLVKWQRGLQSFEPLDGGFMRVVGLLFGRSFRKQSQAFMEDFKAFAEKGTDVRG